MTGISFCLRINLKKEQQKDKYCWCLCTNTFCVPPLSNKPDVDDPMFPHKLMNGEECSIAVFLFSFSLLIHTIRTMLENMSVICIYIERNRKLLLLYILLNSITSLLD